MDTNSPDQDVLDAINREINGDSQKSRSYIGRYCLVIALVFLGLAFFSIAPLYTAALAIIFGVLALLASLADSDGVPALLSLGVGLLAVWMGWHSYSARNLVAAAPAPAVQSVAAPLSETEVVNSAAPAAATAPHEEAEGAHQEAEEAHGEAQSAHHKHFEAQGALVTNHEIALFQETQTAGGVSPSERAQIVTQRLNETAESTGLDPQNIVARMENDLATVYYAKPDNTGYVLATIDPKTAAQFGFGENPGILTFWWRDVLRDHACIIAGNPPIYTTPYSSILQRVYSLCQAEQKGVPTHESFETAISKLSREEHDALQGLYVQVPTNYRPQTD